MNEITLLIGGAILVGVMKVFKDFGVDQKRATLILAILIGVGYYAYTVYAPEAFQVGVATFVTGSLGMTKVVYDAITVLLSKKQ